MSNIPNRSFFADMETLYNQLIGQVNVLQKSLELAQKENIKLKTEVEELKKQRSRVTTSTSK